MYNEGQITVTAGQALEAKRRVKLETGSTTVPPEVVYADAGEQAIGVTEYSVADGDLVTLKPETFPGAREIECIVDSEITYGTVLYAAADGKVTDASSGFSVGISMGYAAVDSEHIPVLTWAVASTAAGSVSIADTGAFTSTATVEAALAEIYQHIASAKAIIPIPMPTITNAGVALAAFSNGDSATPGFCVTAEGLGIRWNNHATPTPVGTKVIVPPDMDAGSDAVLHILAAKVGATVGDAVKFTVEAFNNDVGALYDADADFGGDSSAMTGNAATKTVQEVTLTLANANLTAASAAIELTIQPKDGTLGTDDVILLGAWIEYQRKILTS